MTAKNESTEIATVADSDISQLSLLNDAALSAIGTFEDALNANTVVHDVSEFGTGFEVLDNKDRLIDTPFIIVGARFNDGDFGLFVSLYVVTEGDAKYIVNDGSTGIAQQMARIAERLGIPVVKGAPVPVGLLVKHGLTRSDYKVNIDGKESAASTYYLGGM